MSYYTGRGDYYSGKGDPGLFGVIGSALRGVGSILPGPFGAVAKGLGGLIGGGGGAVPPPRNVVRGPIPQLNIPAIPTPGFGGAVARALPGGSSGYGCATGGCETGYHLDKTRGEKCVRNRRTNYTNPKALSRAAKRMDGFVTVARKALKTTKYKVVNESFKQNWRKPLKK